MNNIIELFKCYEDFSDGYYAVYKGKNYKIKQSDCKTLMLQTRDESEKVNGFINYATSTWNGCSIYGSDYYKVIDKKEASRIYYASFSAIYCGVACNMHTSRPADIREGKFYVAAYASDQQPPDFLIDKGFKENNRCDDFGRKSVWYEAWIPVDNPDLQIVKKESLGSSFGGNEPLPARFEETSAQLIDRLIDVCADMLHRDQVIQEVILGLYGYGIPCKDFPTDIETIMDVVFPKAYEKALNASNFGMSITNEDKERRINNFISKVTSRLLNCDKNLSFNGVGWVDDNNAIVTFVGNERYATYMKLHYFDLLFQREKENAYPYKLDRERINYWLDKETKEWLSEINSGPLYFGDKLITDNFRTFVKGYIKKFEKEYNLVFSIKWKSKG